MLLFGSQHIWGTLFSWMKSYARAINSTGSMTSQWKPHLTRDRWWFSQRASGPGRTQYPRVFISLYACKYTGINFFLLTDGDVVAVRRWFCSISLASDERLFFHNISKLQSLYTEFLTSDNNKHTHHKDTVRMLVSTMWWLLFAGWCPHVIHHAYSWSTS